MKALSCSPLLLRRVCVAMVAPNWSVRLGGFGRVSSSSFRPTPRYMSFQPAEPPGTKSTPLFDDIDTSMVQVNAQRRMDDPNAVIVVTGASRGIGLQMVKTLKSQSKAKILACCRKPNTADDLKSFIAATNDSSRIQTVQLDLTDEASIKDAASSIKALSNGRVDMLFNVAGLLGDGQNDAGPERSLARIQKSWLEKSLAINLVGPLLLTQQLVPLMTQTSQQQKSNERPHAQIVNFSARVGSITDNGLGGWYSYRISKAALNQATRTMAIELQKKAVSAVAVHPGTTNTDLSKPFQKNVAANQLFPVEFTVDSLLKVINGLEDKHSGGLYDWAGKAISF